MDISEIKPGMILKAKRTIRYFMGQVSSDKISRNELVKVDEVFKNAFTVTSHADRYGPWNPEDFTPVKGKV